MSFQPGANLYTQGFASRPEAVEVPHLEARNPSPTDVQYPIGKRWLNTTSETEFILYKFQVVNGIMQAVWSSSVGSTGAVITLSDDNDTKVIPDTTGNIGITGTRNQVTVIAEDPVDHTLQIGIDNPLEVVNFLTSGTVNLSSGTDSPINIGNPASVSQVLTIGANDIEVVSPSTFSEGINVQGTLGPNQFSVNLLNAPLSFLSSSIHFGPTTYNAQGGESVFRCVTTGGAITINLSLNSFFGAFFVINDFSGNAGTNNITVNAPSGSNFLISGSAPSATYVINTNYGNLFAIFDQSTLNIIVLNH